MTQTILIVDDDPFAANGIAQFLRGHYNTQAVFTFGDMLTTLKKQRFDLVILDLNMKLQGNGIDYIRLIKETAAKVLVLTTAVDQQSLFSCFRAEVNGYVVKSDQPETLLKKVQGALAGYLMIKPSLLAEATNPDNAPPLFAVREAELVDKFFANPLASNAELADMINLSEGRVKNMMQAIFKKIRAKKLALTVLPLPHHDKKARYCTLAWLDRDYNLITGIALAVACIALCCARSGSTAAIEASSVIQIAIPLAIRQTCIRD
jgi:DNA-binding NarL/FixJ family response regulator